MGLKICSLFSGSTGNCTYLSDGREDIIIDAGVPLSKIEKALKVLGADFGRLSVLVTHKHTDHVSGLYSLVKKYPSVKAYVHEETAAALGELKIPQSNIVPHDGSAFVVGSVTVSPIELSHDVFCNGYSLASCGKKISYMTDTGVLSDSVLDSVSDSDIVMIESNHSPELLMHNSAYSYTLKRRILGERGHLSNEACAEAVVKLAKSGVKHFILAHLSRENNYPELAYSVTEEALAAAGIYDAGIEVALWDRLGGLTEVV